MMNSRQRAEEQENEEFTLRQTQWKNPTDKPQRVVLFDSTNRKLVVTWAPGEVKSVPSEYDNAIHRVDCGEEHCHKGAGRRGGGWYCTRGHNGTIVGGLAPLLVRVDHDDTLDPSLDPDLARKKQAEADVAAAAITSKLAQESLVIAAARANETNAAKEAAAKEAAAKEAAAKESAETKVSEKQKK